MARSFHSTTLCTTAFILATFQLLLCNHGLVTALSTHGQHSYLDSLKPISSKGFDGIGKERQNDAKDNSMEDVIARTPEDHYAKHHPGAGWAGYKHPMYGGYLDHLSPNGGNAAAATTSSSSTMVNSSYLGSLPENAWEHGKPADYGDDVRWGAQVYLDGL